jgi:hypothetical protein
MGYMTDRLYQYVLDHTREPDILRHLRDETASMHGGHMQASLRANDTQPVAGAKHWYSGTKTAMHRNMFAYPFDYKPRARR